MRILVVGGFPDSLIRFRGPLIKAMLAAKHEVHVAAPDLPASSPIRRALEELGATVHSVPLQRTGINPLSDVGFGIMLFRLMRRIRPQCFLGYTIKPVIYGTIAARACRVPERFALITGLGYAFQGEGKRSLLRELVQRLYSLALRYCRKVFFQNPDDDLLFRSLGLVPPTVESVVLNGSGVDVAAFDVAPLPSRPRFLLIARLLGDKGVREYIAAARIVRARFPEASYGLVGWIDENPDSIGDDELRAWSEQGVIDYLGRLDDVRPAIAGCTVYVLPSYREGTPRTVLEAMSMGRPVITTDAPGCKETVTHGLNGFLVPIKSVDALVSAMVRFIEDPGLAEKMGRRSRTLAEQKYDVNNVNSIMLREMGIQ